MIPKSIVQQQVDCLRGKKVFLTGGTGFFGKSLLDFLLSQEKREDFRITILSRDPKKFESDYPIYQPLNLEFLEGQIEDFVFPQSQFDIILHFATPADAKMNVESPLEMVETIYRGMNHILSFASHCKVKSFLFSSSGAVYGPQPTHMTHISETYSGAPSPTARGAAYGEAKRLAELMGTQHSKKHGYDFKIARCFAFAGKRLNRNGTYAIGNFIRDAMSDRDILIDGDGTSIRSYLYADDLMVWLFKILFGGKNCDPYNVGSDQAVNIRDLAEIVKQTIGSKGAVIVKNKADVAVPASRYVPSIEKAQTELNLQVWTSLEESILLAAKD